MFATRLILKNWRNFREVDVPLTEGTTYLLGPNASGKSNFLDVFRFLRDISKAQGGGLQKAVLDRGGISKLRCLHARRDPDVRIEVHLSEGLEENWRYILSFRHENRGARRILISTEQVWHNEKCLIARPIDEDKSDDTRLTQTHLEQIQTNQAFRAVADFFSDVTYLHLVPQLLKFGDQIGGKRLEDDPFGQGFLERVARTTNKTRESRLKKIEKALRVAVPQFKELGFEKDEVTGRPHLKALYLHHRPNAGWQREDQFSDGTLRLLGLLWSLLESNSLLLLEEPELSLNDAIVRQIPQMIQSVQKQSKRRRQIILSTHSAALLSNPGIDARGVLVIVPNQNGSTIREVTQSEKDGIMSGFSIAETVLPSTRPESAEQLGFW
jgi:predicted ATPase